MADLKNTYITLKLGNGGGGSIDPSVLEGYATSGDMQSAFTLISETQQVAAAGLNQLEGRIDELSGSSVDLSAYWTSAQTQDAIDEKTAKYFTKDAPIIMLDNPDSINAFFGEESRISLLDVTNGYYNDNQFDVDSITGDFTIDKENKEFYIENVPAGIYRIGVYANNVQDPTLTFKVWIDGEEIETNTTRYLPYAVDGLMAILSNGIYYEYANWSLDADAERITFKYDEENEAFDVEVTYKPTIDEAMSAYYTSAQTEDAISAATSGKANAANIEPNTGSKLFPSWNSEGIITGSISPIFNPRIYINNKEFERVTVGGGVWYTGSFYAPESAGTAGQILVSTGNGAPVWTTDNKVSSASVSSIWKGTQAEYDAITTKDPNTFYIIVNN